MRSGKEAFKKWVAFDREAIHRCLTLVEECGATPEDAALCLAGARLKWHLEEESRKEASLDKDGLLRIARLDIDSRLLGFQGISTERHWPKA